MKKTNLRYTDCGLDNVIVHNVDVVIDDNGEESFCITNVRGLHLAIANCVIRQPRSLTGTELRFLRTELGMTQAELANFVKKEHLTVGRWERGEHAIDQNAEAMIRLLAAEHLELLNPKATELSGWCVQKADPSLIRIDAADPSHYKPIAA